MAIKKGRQTYTFKQAEAKVGLITNEPSDLVHWTDGRNVRFDRGKTVSKVLGKSLLATVTGSVAIREIFTFYGVDNTWRSIVCTDNAIFSFTDDFTTETDITPTVAPTGDASSIWTFALIGGMPVLSNSKDGLWKWSISGKSYASTLALLSGTPPTAVQAMATSQNKLITGNIQDGAGSYPARLKWTPSFTPENWTISKEGISADRQDLIQPDSEGMDSVESIRSIKGMGNDMYVYTDRNVWKGTGTSNPYNYRFDIVSHGIGLLAPRAVTMHNRVQYFMSRDDFYYLTPDGTAQPFGDSIRNSCFPNLNSSVLATAFAFYSFENKEVHFCVPLADATTPDTAFVYNTELKNWTIQDVDYTARALSFQGSPTTWADPPFSSWDSSSDTAWDTLTDNGILPYEVVGNSVGEILKVSDTFNNNGVAVEAFIETGDFVFGTDRHDKAIHEVWPHLKPQTEQNSLIIQVGVRQSLSDDITWSAPLPYTIGIDKKVNPRKSGKYVRLRFFTDVADSPFALSGYDLIYSVRGTR